ncbi:nitroreductase [Rhizorhabdus wittichii]|uniref:Nitroreductase n=2 Tax=Rhizorhabdus wittichii TaxID=160791 RepID=A0A9J9H9N9_RHIWR|nr:nitroreductase [Rhizorhabdus wittichii]ABQ67402.1 nitroreductase [Rhizorhabdus wittichii RW1]QTH23398.1 nitroreductase [Rhizorhabdus wittichii]
MPALAIDDDLPDDARALARLVAERHSCRGFLPTPVPRATIDRMLAIAQGSASWCNSQPWEVIVTEGEATDRFREQLYAFAASQNWADQANRPERPDFPFPARYVGIYKDRQRATGWALYEAVGVAYGDREGSGRQMLENFRLFGAPHVMIVTTEEDLGTYGAIDCGGYVAHVLLAAQSLGLATIAQAALAGVADFVRDWFAIPAHRKIVCAISFGFADPAHPANGFRTTRESLGNVVRYVG